MARPSTDLIEYWRSKLTVLDPWRQLRDDEIQALYAEREGAPHSDLAADLRLAGSRTAEVKVILCGARGSGKTTELVRLAHDVRSEFCVVRADLGNGLQSEANTLAVVTLLGVAALHAMRSWEAPDADLATLLEADRGPIGRGAHALDRALAGFGDAVPSVAKLLGGIASIVTLFGVGDPGATATTVAALTSASEAAQAAGSVSTAVSRLRLDLARGPLEGRLDPSKEDDAQAVVEAVNSILDDLRDRAGRPPLLLADGLDKRTNLDDVALALDDESLLRDLRAPLVLTGPVNLRHDARFRAVPGNLRLSLLYNVPVMRRPPGEGAHENDDGVAVLCDLFERRSSEADLPVDLFASGLVGKAAKHSAGIVRDFLRILHEAGKYALIRGARTVASEDLEAAMKKLRLELEGYLDETKLDILGRVLDKGTLPGSPTADTLLFENFIACYHNGDLWFRPHELVVDFVRSKRGDES